MIRKLLSEKVLSEGKKRLIGNMSALFFLQGASYILPLLTFPYLVRVLGADYFGLLAFATATIMYVALIVDYGFNLSATRQISINRENYEKISEIYSSVMIVKFILMIVGFVVTILVVATVERFKVNWEVYIVTFGIVIGQAIFPIWFFQGLEIMKYITYFNILSKIIFTLMIFIFVNEKSDYLLVPAFTVLGSVVTGILSLQIIRKKMKYRISWQKLESIKYQFTQGWDFFVSSISISLYTTSTTFILGFMTDNTTVGQYAAAEKIIQAAKGLYQPFGQALYPYSSRIISAKISIAKKYINGLGLIFGLIMGCISLGLFIFTENIVYFLLGREVEDAISILKIMSPLPIIVAISNIYAVQGLYCIGESSTVNKFVALIAVVHLPFVMLAIHYFNVSGAAYTTVATEMLITLFSIFYFLRKSNEKNNS
jgi:PST family polysaccharide transporter